MMRIPPSAHEPVPILQGQQDSGPHTAPGNVAGHRALVFLSLRWLCVKGFTCAVLIDFHNSMRWVCHYLTDEELDQRG